MTEMYMMQMSSILFVLHSIFPFYPNSESLTLYYGAMLQVIFKTFQKALETFLNNHHWVTFAVLSETPL